ncbi:MAG: ATP-binding protein, partial [Elainellaceae cyanobacterium]
LQPNVFQADNQNYIACKGPLEINGEVIGEMHLALNITESSLMFTQLMWSLIAATGLAIVMITVAIALYVRRSMQPLRQISRLTAGLTLDNLNQVSLHLENAPTEVQELADTCEMTLHRLADSVTQQRQFVHDISHELRTPLTVVYGYVQSILRRGTNLNEMQREALESAQSEAERTIRLLKELLDLARADSDSIEFRQESVHLNALTLDVFKLMQPISNHSFQLEASTSEVYAHVDGDRLTQVLVNLIENAVRYSSAESSITVKLAQTDNSAIIQVCDRGEGIPLQHQSRIFDRCYRVDEARARTTGGSGLGLSIVKSLVDGMGGTIRVQSTLHEGSTFTITLPTLPSDYDRKHRDRRGRRKISSFH